MPASLTLEQILIANANLTPNPATNFHGLDAFEKAVGEKIALVPYKFTDDTRKKLRKWKRAFKVICDDYEETRIAKVKELSPEHDQITEEPPAVQKQFTAWYKAALAETHDFDLPLIKRDGELLVENKNPIPDSVLEALECVCEPDAPAEKAKAAEPAGGE